MASERAKMPVVNIATERLKKFIPGVKVDKILDILPFVALDIEGVEDNVIRVEYNPNRPDFSSDYGVVRALRGLLEIETGAPKFKMAGKSGLNITHAEPFAHHELIVNDDDTYFLWRRLHAPIVVIALRSDNGGLCPFSRQISGVITGTLLPCVRRSLQSKFFQPQRHKGTKFLNELFVFS